MTKFKLSITTPDKQVFAGEVSMATIPGEEGDFGVLSGHSALISNIRTGVVNIYANDNNAIDSRVFVAGGFAEVNETSASVLATEAYDLSKISKEQITAKIEAATTKLNTADNDYDKKRSQEIIDLNKQILALI
jgi:F-type H+-transporting ATPase subunit epsilon